MLVRVLLKKLKEFFPLLKRKAAARPMVTLFKN